ncbi:MAG: helix-turn-helix transcriptional regulator [Planctomycetota bacterium]|nr:helix-turn-helix transcriptional regulator [Planctomycetota bacterium]MDA1215014.1 helix-turn-helix transcriptional regulator [Planctomycetota bacterium]
MHRLRRLRLQRGWNVDELARRAGVSRTTMYLLETGKTATPRAKTLRQIADTLGVAVEDLDSGRASGNPKAEPSLHEEQTEPLRSRNYDRELNLMLNGLVYSVFQATPRLFSEWTNDDWDELYSTFGVGGAMTEEGILFAAEQINRKRTICHQLQVILETEHGETAARVIGALYQLATAPPAVLEKESPFDTPVIDA